MLSRTQFELLFVAFLISCKDERGLAASTICNHANALLYAAKYIYRDHAPKYTDVRFITQLKATATALQKQGTSNKYVFPFRTSKRRY